MMKKFLRMLSIAMALVMCFTMVFTTAVSAEGTTPAITLGDAQTALAGATVTIPVTAEGFADAGIVGAEFNVNLGGLVYKSDDAVVDGEAVANYADGVVRYADVPGDVTDGEVAAYEDGTIFTITATIPEDAETDVTYTVTVSDVVAATSAEEKVEVTGGEVVITVGSAEVPCEHDWVATEAEPATETTDGYITLACTKCDIEPETKAVKWERYSRPMFTGLNLESELLYAQGIRDEVDLDRVGTDGGWTDLYCQFVETKYGVDKPVSKLVNYKDTELCEKTTMSGASVYKFYYGVASTGLGNSITTYAYTYNEVDDTWYSGQTTTESIVSYAKTLLPGATETQKTLFVDALNYGAAAQLAFNYDVDNLVNADLTVNGVDYSSYGTSGDVTAVNNSTAASSSSAEYPLTIPSFGAECESKLILNVDMQFGSKYYESYLDQYDGLYVDVSFTDIFGEDKTVRYYNSTVSDGDYTFTQVAGNARKFSFAFNSFTAGDMRQRVTFKVYTAEGVLLNSDSTYCIEDYVAIKRVADAGNTNILNLVNEMLQFGDSANAFMTSK